MPNTREKLIEVLDVIGSCNAKYCADCEFANDIEGCVRRQKEIIADHLIANGVTFATDNNVGDKLTPTEPLTNCQHWIPVTERLPDNKEHDWVLAQVVEDNGYMHIPKVMEYRQALNDWYEETYGWLSKHNGAFSVTHWMPLPEPPKGE